MGASGHPDHLDDPQQCDHEEPQDITFKAWGKQMVGTRGGRNFPNSIYQLSI